MLKSNLVIAVLVSAAVALTLLTGCATARLESCANKCQNGALHKYRDENITCVCKEVVEW